ncbi:hypothetical protein SAMN04488503_0429 [Humidesulfovibrio mexicanus]|uniref:VOC domain-containing protein n=1 Tax=Humidesulfovibrio mexicanus TaxID=147047 RepID=A0A238XV99_9BACT|nr:hypothetical protein SAMN04488503_0429 [Humidesulfovibrio mexicanus]
MSVGFRNDDTELRRRVEQVDAMRRDSGLAGLVGGLDTVVVSVAPDHLEDAVVEFLGTTGYGYGGHFLFPDGQGCLLTLAGSANFLLRTRTAPNWAFASEPLGPKSFHVPRSRVESMVFACPDLERYVGIQKRRGVRFMTEAPVRSDGGLFIRTAVSTCSALSYGFVQREVGSNSRALEPCRSGGLRFAKPDAPHLRQIGVFDHASVRVRARDRDDAIVEFLELTNYEFSMAVYVDNLNSITNVARLPGEPYAMVITSGLGDSADGQEGPTEKFIRNYGRRIHHLAFRTSRIEETFAGLKAQGMEFLLELVGSPEEGLKQTFSRPSPHTLIVNEYIQRYEGFEGFFTKSNVTLLTEATARQ